MEETQRFELLCKEAQAVVYMESLTSTQDYIRANWQNLPQFTVCLTDYQEHGRGRYQRIWQAPEKSSLLISTLVPLTSRTRYGWATIAGALAAREACAEAVATQEIFLKWPNDIIDQNGKKLAGILGEVLGEKNGVLYGAIGLGINMMQKETELPPGAVSLRLIKPGALKCFEPSRQILATLFLRKLKTRLRSEKTELLAEYRKYCADIGQRKHFFLETEEISGIVQGIDADGSLIIGKRHITYQDIARAALNKKQNDYLTE